MRLALAVLHAEMVKSQKISPDSALTRHHDQQLHQVIIDRGRAGRLQYEDVLISDTRVDLDRRLSREKLRHMAGCEVDAESVWRA